MGLEHRDLPIQAVQFHPESIRSEHGHALLQNFVNMMKVPA
jgi:anthranilate synthase component 2